MRGRKHHHQRRREQLHVVLKQISKFNGKKVDEFLEWSSKLRANLSIYNKAIFNIIQGQK